MSTTAILVAVAAAVVAAVLVAVIRTRWLQSRTLEKCVALSVVLHAILAIVCACVGGWQPASHGTLDEGRITLVMTAGDEPAESPTASDQAFADAGEAESPADMPPPLVPLASADQAAPEPPSDHVSLLDAPDDAAASPDVAVGPPEDASKTPRDSAAPPAPAPRAARMPDAYADRQPGRREAVALARGGSEATEQAVASALGWLVAAQSADGRWDAARHGAGIERTAEGRHRPGPNARVDHGVTGLAMLALLGAGSTHREGPHAVAVARGVGFLTGRQQADGSLAGEAEFFARLYCHGMATIALAECLAMSGDATLRPVVERAVTHTLSMQHPHTGGWRYAAGDRGDTSQCGWQVMVLASARAAGLGGFEAAETKARRYLQSVAGGHAGGMASYRPGERPSMAMTAEALYCRLLLGASVAEPSTAEALQVIAAAPPVASSCNAYAWYYATLALFHAGGPQWDRWNGRMQQTLVSLQRREPGPLEGSWDPDPVWGAHGGRVYATALSALTLEVYYRYAPLHQRNRMAAAPGRVAP